MYLQNQNFVLKQLKSFNFYLFPWAQNKQKLSCQNGIDFFSFIMESNTFHHVMLPTWSMNKAYLTII